jgi:hypothetical protein
VFFRSAKKYVCKSLTPFQLGVQYILQRSPVFQGLGQSPGQDPHVNLIVLLWGDNCQKLTALRFRLIDRRPGGGIFPTTDGMSAVYDLLAIIGGEGHLPPFIPQCTASFHEGMSYLYSNKLGLASASVFKAFCVGDHHFLNLMQCIPGSSSLCRDTFGNTIQYNWARFPFDNASQFDLTANADNFMAIQDLILRAQSFNQLLKLSSAPGPDGGQPSNEDLSLACGCTKGDCSTDNCRCKKNGRQCSSRCHKSSGQHRCTRFEAESVQPVVNSNIASDVPLTSASVAAPTGLQNYGNTCWANSVLQCIRSQPCAVTAIKSTLAADGSILGLLQSFLDDDSNHEVLINAWITAVGFVEGEQQDAGEGYTTLFDKLNESRARGAANEGIDSGILGFAYYSVIQPTCSPDHVHTSSGESMDCLQLYLRTAGARGSLSSLMAHFFEPAVVSSY